MIDIEKPELFAKAIADALKAIDGNDALQTWEKLRCLNAVAKASHLLQTSPFIDFDGDADTLLIWSDSNNIYEIKTDGACQCRAYESGNMCWHRAAKRLVQRYLALLTASYSRPAIDHSDTPYLKNTANNSQIVGGVRI